MNDQLLWNKGLLGIEAILADLQTADRQRLSELLAGLRLGKESLYGITMHIGSESTCRICSGQCCQNGKYRMSVLDVLSCRAEGVTIYPDFLQKPLCPYGTSHGCTLEPGFRPTDCILFICDVLELRLTDVARADLATIENSIRGCMQEASQLLALQVTAPLLLWAENKSKLRGF